MKKLHLLCAVAVIAALLSGCAEMNRRARPRLRPQCIAGPGPHPVAG